MSEFKILVSDSLDANGIEILKQVKGFKVDFTPKISPDELKVAIKDYDALLIRSRTKVTSDIVENAQRLKVIARAGVGLDNVDIEAASAKGIIVVNAPAGNTISTAEHAFSMMMAMSRNIAQADASMKKGLWEKKKFMGVELYGKILGVIGLGRIGANFAKKAIAFGMKVVAYDPYLSQEKANELGVESVKLDELFKKSDYITMHIPLTDDTKNLIRKETISKMKDGVRIINCARGGIVNESDLADAINSGKVAAAALDVFEKEPISSDNPLIGVEKVILTPHLGASTEEAQTNVAIEAAETVRDILLGKGIKNAVNTPCLDAEVAKVLDPYLNLAEKLGAMQAQLAEGVIKRVKISYVGDIINYDTSSLSLAVIKGMLTPVLQETVNYVNATVIAKERGIDIVESKAGQIQDFANLLIVEIETDKGKNLIMGTLFTKKNPRVVKINDYYIDAVPSGNMLCISNKDVPGIVGSIGSILAEGNINIAGMTFGRITKGGEALSLLNIDTPLNNDLLEKIRKAPNVNDVKMIRL